MIWRRWLFSTLVGTITLVALMAITGEPRRGAIDALNLWLAVVAGNCFRIAIRN